MHNKIQLEGSQLILILRHKMKILEKASKNQNPQTVSQKKMKKSVHWNAKKDRKLLCELFESQVADP